MQGPLRACLGRNPAAQDQAPAARGDRRIAKLPGGPRRYPFNLRKIDGGQAVFTIRADRPGTYQWLVRGRSTGKGPAVYQREIRLTGSVWEEAPPTEESPVSMTTKRHPDEPEKGG